MNDEAEKDHLRALIASAEAVEGQVVSTRRTSEPDVARMSEHDPDWHVAIIRITRTLKGEHKDEMAVRFPKSRDIACYRVPKPREGAGRRFHSSSRRPGSGRRCVGDASSRDLLPAEAENVRRIAELAEPHERK